MLIIVSPFENDLTGRGTRYPDILKAAKTRNIECKILTSNFNHSTKTFINIKELSDDYTILKVNKYKGHYSLSRIICHWIFSIKLAWFFILNRNDISTVIVSSIPPEVLFVASLFLKNTTNIVVDVRDIWPDAYSASGSKSLLRRGFEVYCNALYFPMGRRTNKKVVCVASSFNSWAQRYLNTKEADTHFIPLGFDPSRWGTKDRNDVSTSHSSLGRKYFYIGGLTEQFNLLQFQPFLKDGSDLVVIGDGPLLVQYKRVFPKALFLGVLSFHESSKVVLSSQIGLLPITGQAHLPNKAFDFIASGKPVITMQKSEAFEFLSNYIPTIDHEVYLKQGFPNNLDTAMNNYFPPQHLSKKHLSVQFLEQMI